MNLAPLSLILAAIGILCMGGGALLFVPAHYMLKLAADNARHCDTYMAYLEFRKHFFRKRRGLLVFLVGCICILAALILSGMPHLLSRSP